MTIEEQNQIQPEVEDIEVEVTESQEVSNEASSDDELENYTKGVSKRINKLNERKRAAEEKAAALEAALQQREQEVHAYYNQAVTISK
jgi:PBP1b-binding outer membrane lipoprotein LpoB